MQLKSIAVSLLLLASCEALRILVVFPMASKSHSILGHGVVNRLLEAGHEVVHLTAIPREEPEKNLKEIVVPDGVESLSKSYPENFNSLTLKNIVGKPNVDSTFFFDLAFDFHKLFLEDKNVVEFLGNPKEKFDAVIIEWFFSDVVAGYKQRARELSEIYHHRPISPRKEIVHWVEHVVKTQGAPHLRSPSLMMPWYQKMYIDLITIVTFITAFPLKENLPKNYREIDVSSNAQAFMVFNCPMIWSYSIGPHWMTLRLIDEITNPAFAGDYLAETMPKEKAVYKRIFEPLFESRGQSLPNYDDILYNASLVLANDFRGNGLMPSTPQNFHFIGGMGSLWQSKDLPKSIINGLLKVFGELKQTVIWKFEEVLPNLPKNVHILKWAPQTSILAHPKCLFFITHGGHLSSIESVHFGVPTIGVPIFFDQFININKAVNNGYAIKELSFIYHNRPLPPGKELVHWVEHVVRTGGAPHLRSPALMLPWYQKMYLDLCAIILCISAIVLVTLIRLCTSKK
ncbi:hypothetical protein MSG28_011810, partial [Choristoneura fumiferana]